MPKLVTWGMAGAVLRIAVLLLLGPGRADAQQPLFARELFTPPSPVVVDYERYYLRVDDCLAAVRRIKDSLAKTMLIPRNPGMSQPMPAPMVEMAHRCGRRFLASVPSASPADLPLLADFAQQASDDSAMAMVVARRLALLSADASPARRAEVLFEGMDYVVRARPSRMALAKRLLGDIERLGPEARLVHLKGHLWLWQGAMAAGDTIEADRYPSVLRALADSVPVPERDTSSLAQMARNIGSEDYYRLRALARGEAVAPVRPGVMPSIEAEFWFRRPDSTTPRPVFGKPNLVVYVDADCLTRSWGTVLESCYGSYAGLRDLHQRFGAALEITLVAHTHGYFRNYPPPTPAEEAELLRHYFFEHLKLPGTLAVQVTPFERVPAPDRRRMNERFPSTHGLAARFVDRDGQILFDDVKLNELLPYVLAGIQGWLTRPTAK